MKYSTNELEIYQTRREEVQEYFDISSASFYKHLSKLVKHGLLIKESRNYYKVNRDVFQWLSSKQYFDSVEDEDCVIRIGGDFDTVINLFANEEKMRKLSEEIVYDHEQNPDMMLKKSITITKKK